MKAKHFKSRHALLMSLTSLMLCVSMLFGATFAWFTDSVTSGVNRIVSGNLDVEVSHTNAKGETAKIDAQEKLFMVDIEGKDLLWEPEVISYETFKVSNEGTLALKYAMTLNNVGYNYVNGTNNWLGDVIQVAVTNTAPADRAAAKALSYSQTLSQFVNSPLTLPTGLGTINAGDNDQEFTIVLYWPQGVRNDNDYNLGHINGVDVESSDGNPLYVNLGITLVATQESNENDSFGKDYDAGLVPQDEVSDPWAGVAVASTTVTAVQNASNDIVATAAVAANPANDSAKQTTVTLTAATGNDAAFSADDTVKLDVTTNDIGAASNTAYAISANNSAVASIDLSLFVIKTTTNETTGEVTVSSPEQKHDGFIAEIETYITPGLSGVNVAYTGNGEGPSGVTYDSESGKLTFTATHFSEYVVTSTDVAYNNDTQKGFSDLNGAIAAAKGTTATIVLLKDVNDGSGLMTADGSERTSEITIDFNGHTYTMKDPSVGSTGTQTQAMHWGESAKSVTLKNGTFKIVEGAENVKMAMQGYIPLTLTNMVLDLSNVPVSRYGVYEGQYAAFSNQLVPSFNVYEDSTFTNTKIYLNADDTVGMTADKTINLVNSTIYGAVSIGEDTSKIILDSASSITKGVKEFYLVNTEESVVVSGTENGKTVYTLGDASIEALKAKAAAAGATDIAVDGTGVVGTMSDGVVYKWYADGTVYIKDASGYNGNNGTGITDSTYYIVGGLVSVNGIIEGAFLNANISKVKFTSNLESAWKGFCGSANSEPNTHLTTVEFSDVVTEIPARVFCNCTALTSITIPNTITKIGEGAFRQSGLTSITIPASVQTIDKEMVAYCPNITAVTFEGSPAINQYYIGRASAKLADIYFMGADTTFTYAKCITFSHTEGGVADGITVHFVNEALKNAFEGVNSSTQMTLTVDSQA